MRSTLLSSSLSQTHRPSPQPPHGAIGIEIPVEERESILRKNLARLGEEIHPTAAQMDSWRSNAADQCWYRTSTGNMIRSAGSRDPVAPIEDARAVLGRAIEPLIEQINNRFLPPVLLEGVDPPWLLKALVETGSPNDHPSFRQRVLVLQADWNELLDGLSHVDLGDGLGDARIVWFVGDGASDRLLAWIDERIDDAPPKVVIQNPHLRTKSSPDAPALIREIDARWLSNAQELVERVRARQRHDRHWWSERFAQAERAHNPLRVLIPVSRHTTYLKYAADDLAKAFERQGWLVRVQIERDDSELISPNTHLRSVVEFHPDLIVSINYTRSSLGDHFPRDIPHVCWMQDAMVHLFDRALGESFGEMDFIVGMIKEELIEEFGYPRARTRWMAMVASPAKFGGLPKDDGFESEIAWVTHQSEHPDRLRDRMVQQMSTGAPDAGERLASVLDEVRRLVTSEPHAFVFTRLNEILDNEFFGGGVARPSAKARSNLFNGLIVPYTERVFRHQTAQWAANIATRRGWRLKLFGHGWDQHPQLSSFAAGPVEHGDQLRRCYQGSIVHLHASVNQVTHQRVSECLLSGGLVLCRTVRDSFALMNNQIASDVYQRQLGESVVDDSGQQIGWRIRIADCPRAQMLIEHLRRLKICSGDEYRGEWIEWPMFKVHDAIRSLRIPSEAKNAEMFSSMSDLYFASEPQLEALIERAIQDPPWRHQRILRALDEMPRKLTIDGFVDEIITLVRSGLAQDSNPDQIRS